MYCLIDLKLCDHCMGQVDLEYDPCIHQIDCNERAMFGAAYHCKIKRGSCTFCRATCDYREIKTS